MGTIIESAKGLLNEKGTILNKAEEDIKRLSNPSTSVYASETKSITDRTRVGRSLANLLADLGDIQSDQPLGITHPIVDYLQVQKGFNGDDTTVYKCNVASTKALLYAEGGVTEGKIFHTGVITQIDQAVGIQEYGLEDSFVGRIASPMFAKRDNQGGFNPEDKTVTKKENASGIDFRAPYDASNPWEPELGNKLGQIAAWLANLSAVPFYNEASGFQSSRKKAILTVCNRNANGPTLDRKAEEFFSRRINPMGDLDLDDQMAVRSLLNEFRSRRSTIGIEANSPSCETLKIGMPYCEYSFSPSIKWTNAEKQRRVKKVQVAGGQTVYMAPSYMNFQLFTVPIRLELIPAAMITDIIVWQHCAMVYCVNQARHILGYETFPIDNKTISYLEHYIQDKPIRRVYEALGLTEEENTETKKMISAGASRLMEEIYAEFTESIENKTLRGFNQGQSEIGG